MEKFEALFLPWCAGCSRIRTANLSRLCKRCLDRGALPIRLDAIPDREPAEAQVPIAMLPARKEAV